MPAGVAAWPLPASVGRPSVGVAPPLPSPDGPPERLCTSRQNAGYHEQYQWFAGRGQDVGRAVPKRIDRLPAPACPRRGCRIGDCRHCLCRGATAGARAAGRRPDPSPDSGSAAAAEAAGARRGQSVACVQARTGRRSRPENGHPGLHAERGSGRGDGADHRPTGAFHRRGEDLSGSARCRGDGEGLSQRTRLPAGAGLHSGAEAA